MFPPVSYLTIYWYSTLQGILDEKILLRGREYFYCHIFLFKRAEMARIFLIDFWAILRTRDPGNIGSQAILSTLDPGNTGSQAILRTLDPGNTGSNPF